MCLAAFLRDAGRPFVTSEARRKNLLYLTSPLCTWAKTYPCVVLLHLPGCPELRLESANKGQPFKGWALQCQRSLSWANFCRDFHSSVWRIESQRWGCICTCSGVQTHGPTTPETSKKLQTLRHGFGIDACFGGSILHGIRLPCWEPLIGPSLRWRTKGDGPQSAVCCGPLRFHAPFACWNFQIQPSSPCVVPGCHLRSVPRF